MRSLHGSNSLRQFFFFCAEKIFSISLNDHMRIAQKGDAWRVHSGQRWQFSLGLQSGWHSMTHFHTSSLLYLSFHPRFSLWPLFTKYSKLLAFILEAYQAEYCTNACGEQFLVALFSGGWHKLNVRNLSQCGAGFWNVRFGTGPKSHGCQFRNLRT